jgi:hypothetical protein
MRRSTPRGLGSRQQQPPVDNGAGSIEEENPVPPLLWIPILLLVGAPLGIAAIASAFVLMFRYSKHPLTPKQPGECPDQMAAVGAYSEWAEDNGFTWIGAYSVTGGAFMAVWQMPEEPTYFCVYILPDGRQARDFVTILDGTGGLTTGDSPDACLFPTAPGEFKQTFPGCTAAEQHDIHGASLDYLKQAHRVSVRSDYGSFEEAFQAGMTEPMKYVMSLPLWPLRTPYWFFVRRKKVRNLTVAQLLERGLATTRDQGSRPHR